MRDDLMTVSAVSVIAMCVATFAHEAAGHGSACLALGGHILQLTSVYFQCTPGLLVAPEGPAGNLVAGGIAWLALIAIPATAVRARLFALLLMAFSFFWFAGYLVYAMVLANGDYYFAGKAFMGELETWWRIAGGVTGIVLYLLAVRIVATSAKEFPASRARIIFRTAWTAATVAAIAAAALYVPDRSGAMVQAGLEIGAATLPLLLMDRRVTETGNAPSIAQSYGWIGAAVLVFAAFAATLGRGVS